MKQTTMNIDQLFKEAVDKGASDLHLVVGKPPILRIDGVLTPIEKESILTAKEVLTHVHAIISDKQRAAYEADRELDTSYAIDGGNRFRVNCHWEKGNPGMVARIITPHIPTLEELSMPEVVFDLLRLKQGLILVTGPTGSGKSTSLAAMINLINKERAEHIVTLEDPIEFIYAPDKSIIKQRQLGTDMVSFAQALKHVLRQDPNVILVGEMRDLETISATITLAETGHLVLATLHTYNAAQTIDRIIDVFPPYQQNQVRLQVSLFLKAVISQQLLPRKKGGRIASREVMVNNAAIANLIRENKVAQIKTVIQTSAHEGMVTMDQDLKRLFDSGEVDKDIAQLYMMAPDLLED